MSLNLHGQRCTIVLFVQPGGELESLMILAGTLDCTGEAPTLQPDEGGETVRIPEHLIDLIEPVTDEHREILEDITTPYCLIVFYNGRLEGENVDVNALLDQCAGEPGLESAALQRTGPMGWFSRLIKRFRRHLGL